MKTRSKDTITAPLSTEHMSMEALNQALQVGFRDFETGNVHSIESVIEEMERDYGI